MKKQLLLPLIALMSILLAFTLMSCKADLNGESTTEISADTKQDCFQLLDQFFEDVFKDANVVVTFKIDDDIWFTENIKGTTSNVLFHDTEVKSYAYKDGDSYCVANESEDSHYHETNKEYYDASYGYFLAYPKMIANAIPEDEGVFSCVIHIEEKNSTVDGTQTSTSTGELTFSITNDAGLLKIIAHATNNVVQDASIEYKVTADPTQNRNIEIAFDYGHATVTIPDTAEWDRIANNDEAINQRNDFFSTTIEADNVTISGTGFIEKIANGVDYYKYDSNNEEIYLFISEDGDYIIATSNDSGKTYYKSEELYENKRLQFFKELGLDNLSHLKNVVVTCNISDDEKELEFIITILGKEEYKLTAQKDDSGLITTYSVNSSGNISNYTIVYNDIPDTFEAPDITQPEWEELGENS